MSDMDDKQLDELLARAREGIPELATVELSATEREAESRSRLALEARLGSKGRAPTRSRAPRRWRTAVWLAPVAAAAALVLIISPWRDQEVPRIGDLRVTAVTSPDESRSPTGGSGFRSGDVVSLQFNLTEDAWVVAYYVSPSGDVELVIPGSLESAVPFLQAGEIELPGEQGADEWVLGIETGTETFVVAAKADAPLDPALVAAGIKAQMGDLGTLAALQALLNAQTDVVETIRIERLR